MVSTTAATSSNPKPKSKNAYHVGGIQVKFPYHPYGSQLAFMGRIISTLDRAQRDGHCHALLESPTGTGKSLSLLCSTLAWQQNYLSKNQHANSNLTHPEAVTDPLGHGGGFIPDTQPSRNLPSSVTEPAQTAAAGSKGQKKRVAPTIFFASRTHSQISQLIREYRKTAYRVPMLVLASRKHYCTNAHVNVKENIDEECKLLFRNQEPGCLHFKNVHKVKGHLSLQRGGCHEVYDIEDLVKVGKLVKGCPYFAVLSVVNNAQLVFCPYSYIINPVIRGALDIDIKGAILVLDEAHNIEDIARDAGSVDVEEDVLHKLQMELGQLCAVDTVIYQPLYEMAQDLVVWIERKKNSLEKHGLQHYFCWTGDKALRELQEANISQQCYPILLDCATKAIKAATDLESEAPHLSGMSVAILEGLFSSLTYFFSRNGLHTSDYQLALQRHIKIDRRHLSDWTHTLSLWCMNPSVVFRDIADISLSIILTSGTLSPMNSFSSELGVHFGTCLEAPHVIDVKSQVWAAVISTGPNKYPLNASYKTADGYAFQDALGKSLEEICKIIPAGSLVFFPSYKLMEKLCNRWRETGQWSRLNARKSLFVEPRGGSQEDFDRVLKDYYDLISQGNMQVVGRKRNLQKLGLDDLSTENSKNEGAAFLAVCRGKVSEGMDFSDDNARVNISNTDVWNNFHLGKWTFVQIVVGIPFPNTNDIQVGLKKKYNDMNKASKNLLSGNEWYCHQAFRALNQAIGRCIRHKFDYGAIILLDERYEEERNRIYVSKWLRKSIRHYGSFEASLEGLKLFFKEAKEKVGKNMEDDLVSAVNEENSIPPKEKRKKSARSKTLKKNNSDHKSSTVTLSKCDAMSPALKSQSDIEERESALLHKDIDICKEIDLGSDSQKNSRCYKASSYEDVEMTFVKETPVINGSAMTYSPGSFSKEGNSSSTMIQDSNEATDQGSLYSFSLKNQSKPLHEAQCWNAVTPEKELITNSCSPEPEVESYWNMSVNSQAQKGRKPVDVLSIDQSYACNANTPDCISGTRGSIMSRDANRRIQLHFDTTSEEHQSTRANTSELFQVDSCTASCVSSDLVMDKKLRVYCSLCKSPVGLPENHMYLRCSLTLSSKVHLVSLMKERLDTSAENTSACIPVLIVDILSVDKRLCNSFFKDAPQEGIWCQEDGCVYKSIFCPFCNIPNCLGVQIMAADASNVQLLNKILFYYDRLEVQNLEASEEQTPVDDKDVVPVSRSRMDKTTVLKSIDKFSYSPQRNSDGWRTTKSKLRLPKTRDLVSNGKD